MLSEQAFRERLKFLEARIGQLMCEAEQIDQEIIDAELEMDEIAARLHAMEN